MITCKHFCTDYNCISYTTMSVAFAMQQNMEEGREYGHMTSLVTYNVHAYKPVLNLLGAPSPIRYAVHRLCKQNAIQLTQCNSYDALMNI